jgi:hypothetical protein
MGKVVGKHKVGTSWNIRYNKDEEISQGIDCK